MKILALTSSYPRYEGDPTAPFIESITRNVAARGHTVHVVLPEHREWARPHDEDRVHYHPYRYTLGRSRTPWGYSTSLTDGVRIKRTLYPIAPLVYRSARRTCEALVSRERFDVVHVHWVIPNGPIGSSVAKRNGLPLVASLHGSDLSISERSNLLGRLARRTFAHAAAVTAPSGEMLGRARQLGARGLLEVVPYGADPDAFAADAAEGSRMRDRLGLNADQIAVLGIGRFVSLKGFTYLIGAFAQAVRACPGIRLVLVGDGDVRAELEAQVERLGLGDVVTFTGMAPREEVPRYLAAADIVAVPSVHYRGYVDGLPNVALEAMASTKPLVATRVGGLPEIVRDGENGLLVAERDPHELADAIVALATDPDLRTKMGQRGRAMIGESFNWSAVAERFEDVYERVAR